MKNHKMVDGKLLQTNKKWSALKLSQKEYISNLIREEYVDFIKENNHHPKDEEKEELLNKVYSKIEEREIWIPFSEVKKQFLSKTSKLARK